jgi:hypothetical protein
MFFFFAESPIKNEKDLLFVAGQIAYDFSLYWTQIHQLRFIHVLLYLSRKKGIRAIHLKEALFNKRNKVTRSCETGQPAVEIHEFEVEREFLYWRHFSVRNVWSLLILCNYDITGDHILFNENHSFSCNIE